MRKTIIVYSPVGRIKARSKDVGRLLNTYIIHIRRTTALILKRIRESLFWNHSESPKPGNTDLSFPKCHVPTQKQFYRIFIVLQDK